MAVPDIAELQNTARRVVLEAKKEGKLTFLTPRIVRQEVETLLDIEPGTLDATEYKNAVKVAVSAAVEEPNEEVPANGSEGRIATAGKKRKSKGIEESKPAKKTKTTAVPKSKKIDAPAIVAEKGKETKTVPKVHKSKATIESSDDEEKPPKSSANKKPLSKKGLNDAEAGPSTNHRRSNSALSDDLSPPNPPKPIKTQTSVSNSRSVTQVIADTVDDKSDSELSVLIDEPVKRGKKGKAKEKEKPEKQKRQKKPAVELSKDEETVKRLKSLVVACGVRKVWSKEFQDLDKPSQQIKRIKEILADLGMKGRFSLEQAKNIKEKRELAQELEDVTKFEQAVASQASRTRGKGNQSTKESTSPDEDEDESHEDEAPVKRRNTARQSIMAFLGDESDE